MQYHKQSMVTWGMSVMVFVHVSQQGDKNEPQAQTGGKTFDRKIRF